MASYPVNELRISAGDYEPLRRHLLRDDHDEHGAILLAGQRERPDGGITLTVREVHTLASKEFPPGEHGYRQFAPAALARLGNRASEQQLALLSIHSHPGAGERNGLSGDDLRAHERVFPYLLDITAADAVAGVALGERSVAGEIWCRDHSRANLDRLQIIGANALTLRPRPRELAPGAKEAERFDRQVRLFGPAGQALLRELHVAVIGAGGGGSILIEQLAHLGVGEITAVDFDIVKRHNLSRIIGATEADAHAARKKVDVVARMVAQVDPSIAFHAIDGDIADVEVAERLLDADHLLLATDTATARLVANALAQTFLIPLVQIGAKVESRDDGTIEQIYTAVRPVLPRRGCLACAGLIDPIALQREAASPQERADQNYLGDADVIDPSVTTLNVAAAAGALNVLLMSVIGQADDALAEHRLTFTREGTSLATQVERDPACRWCGEQQASRYARADVALLPCRPRAAVIEPLAQRPRWRRLGRLLDWFGAGRRDIGS
jgi:molybdopterin/thiamine biosynthesis adenylyltransferase